MKSGRWLGLGLIWGGILSVLSCQGTPGDGAGIDVPREEQGLVETRFHLSGISGPAISTLPPGTLPQGLEPETPWIECLSPVDRAMVRVPPGGVIGFQGAVHGLGEGGAVSVNGVNALVSLGGRFEAPFQTRFGVNFAEIAGRDASGAWALTTCAFLATDRFAGPDEMIPEAISLRLGREAIDDGDPGDGFDSVNDLLDTILASEGLQRTLDAVLAQNSPFLDRCLVDTWFGCLLRSRAEYRGLAFRGASRTALPLDQDRIGAQASVTDVAVRVRLVGTAHDTTGWVTLQRLSFFLIFRPSLQDGTFHLLLDEAPLVEVGGVETDFDGVDGVIVDALANAFEGKLRTLIGDAIRDSVIGQVNQTLDGFVSSLDVSSLGQGFAVPRLDRTGEVRLRFDVRPSWLGCDPARILFGLGTRLLGDEVKFPQSPGAALPPGATLLDPPTDSSVAVAVDWGFFNQALHALWQSGFFDVTLAQQVSLEPFFQDARVHLSAQLPLVLSGAGPDQVRVSAGAIQVTLLPAEPGAEPIVFIAGATAHAGVFLQGSSLGFTPVVLDEVFLDLSGQPVDGDQLPGLKATLRQALQSALDQTLNSALPRLPLPTFTTPSGVELFGIPAGLSLGLRASALSLTESHALLTGAFGQLPR